ncbi:hypothetical protein MNBD_GAMMA12-2316 [hydrothermal vent metagenome]|uniref:Uncharacterized protein n=1 Tax=hydrothermal vent metagenome TaxID=652676 RepID=A0A3B0YW87_9ZZZZ
MTPSRRGQRWTPGDILFLVLALLLIVSSYFFLWRSADNQHQGHTADIIVNQKTVMTVSLRQNKTYQIKGYVGLSTIVVYNGKIRFSHSACSKKYCILSGWHQLSGDTAACLPNRVLIRVNGTPKGFDVLNY